MNKRGSHVGIILSFVMFVTFVVFFYSVLEPTSKISKERETAIENFKIELQEELSEDLVIVTMLLDPSFTTTDSCIGFEILPERENMNLIILDKDKNIIPYNIENSQIKIDWNNDKLFRFIYSYEKFKDSENTETQCTSMTKDNEYKISSIRIEKYIFEQRILNFSQEINNDYSILNNRLEVPNDVDFGFNFEYHNGTIISANEKEVDNEIFVEDIPIQYVNSEGNINTGHLFIKAW